MYSAGTVHHPNDILCKFCEDVMPEKLKNYFKLPGKFVRNFPTVIIKRNGAECKMDWLILVKPDNETLFEEILINIEFQSSAVTKEKIEAMADYSDYSKLYYGRPVLTVVIITDGYENSIRKFERTKSDILEPIYIGMDGEEVFERLKILEEKICNHENLSDDESLDIMFLPMFATKGKREFVTEKIAKLFSKDKSLKGIFRSDIAFGLSIMIKKYFESSDKGKELLKLIEPELNSSRLRDVVDFEVGYIRRSLEKELNKKNEDLSKMGEVISEQGEALSEKDKVISEQGEALSEKDEVISEQGEALSEKDEVISEQGEALSEKDEVIFEQGEKIRELEKKLAENGIY